MWTDIWGTHNLIVVTILIWMLAYIIGLKYKYITAMAIFYFLTSATFVYMNPDMPYATTDYRIHWSTAAAFTLGILCLVYSAFVSKKLVEYALETIEYIIVLDSIVVLFYGFGIFNASSFDASVIAMVYPSLWLRKGVSFRGHKLIVGWTIFSLSIPIIAILSTKSATPFYIFFAQAFVFLMMKKKHTWVIGAAAVCFVVGFLSNGSELFNSSGRTPVWTLMMTTWWNKLNVWTGTGTGTYHYLGPIFQPNDFPQFLFLHNEYLQILFEQGIVGFVLIMGVLFSCLRRAWGSEWLMTTWSGILMCCVSQFPFRFGLSLLFVMLIARVSLEREVFS